MIGDVVTVRSDFLASISTASRPELHKQFPGQLAQLPCDQPKTDGLEGYSIKPKPFNNGQNENF